MRFLSIKKVAQLRDIVKSVQMNYNIGEKAHKISNFRVVTGVLHAPEGALTASINEKKV